MASSPEIESKKPDIEFTPEEVDIREGLQREGVQPRPASPQPVTGDQGQPLAQPTGQGGMIPAQIPVSGAQAKTWSRGSPSDSKTWLGVYVLRKIKQALLFGWKVVIGGK